MPFKLNSIASQRLAQQFLARFGLFQIELGSPLKWSVRFRDKSRDTGGDLTAVLAGRRDFTAQINDPQQIFFGLAWQAQHEVELDTLPAQAKKHACRLD